ncbi:hypothetical protein [Petrimonas sulfuriphila]|uniref:hypothetical protein n=1 Tax=Petrimonas sulfuriphila TaxID=285070 RepID=UPI003EBFC1AD
MRFSIRSFLAGINNLVVWFPLIWKLRDFDYSYGVNLFMFYLKTLRKGINKYRSHVDYEHDLATLDRFIKMYEFYDSNGYFERYVEQLRRENIPPLYSNEPVSEDEYARREELFRDCVDKGKRLEDILWRYLRQNMGRWWD